MTDIYSIDFYLTDTVTINRISISRGQRSISVVSSVPAKITNRTEVVRGTSGDQIGASDVSFRATVVYLKPDQAIGLEDEIVVDGETKPVKRIERVRDGVGIRFLRVFL